MQRCDILGDDQEVVTALATEAEHVPRYYCHICQRVDACPCTRSMSDTRIHCRLCSTLKPPTAYSPSRRRSKYHYCNACVYRRYNKPYRERHPEVRVADAASRRERARAKRPSEAPRAVIRLDEVRKVLRAARAHNDGWASASVRLSLVRADRSRPLIVNAATRDESGIEDDDDVEETVTAANFAIIPTADAVLTRHGPLCHNNELFASQTAQACD